MSILKCTCCGCIADTKEDVLDTQEWLLYADTGGYGSIIGDGVTWSIRLCQLCIKYKLEDSIEVHE